VDSAGNRSPPQHFAHLHIIQLSRISTLLNESPKDWKTDNVFRQSQAYAAMIIKDYSVGLLQQEREAQHSPPSIAEVKGCMYLSDMVLRHNNNLTLPSFFVQCPLSAPNLRTLPISVFVVCDKCSALRHFRWLLVAEVALLYGKNDAFRLPCCCCRFFMKFSNDLIDLESLNHSTHGFGLCLPEFQRRCISSCWRYMTAVGGSMCEE